MIVPSDMINKIITFVINIYYIGRNYIIVHFKAKDMRKLSVRKWNEMERIRVKACYPAQDLNLM